MLTPLLFAMSGAALVWCWNRFFAPVPLRIALALWLICAVYEGETRFTKKVDLPARLAFVAYPWKATGRTPVRANTGIVFTQIAPWTRVARDTLLAGEAPLWNRTAAGGAPLLANQQTAIFHPFTLLGLLLSLGKAFTLSAALRLFTVSFFTFIFLRELGAGTAAAFFGTMAFTFCTFHVVWLLFPLGLATMMLPACLVGAHEVVLRPRPAAYLLLVIALGCSVLGGHPESALWVWIVTAMYAAFTAFIARRFGALLVAGSTFILAMLLTAFFWLPTLSVLRYTSRYGAMQSPLANPANHGLTYEWLLPLLSPNILGTPVNGTYTPPRGSHPAVLNDYGEVASGYAGLSTLCLALAAPFTVRRRPALIFGIFLMAFSLLTIAETPLWRDLLRSIPFVGISLHQRLRVLWALGACIGAALTMQAMIDGRSTRPTVIALIAGISGVIVLYAVRHQTFALLHALVPVLTAGVLLKTRKPEIAVALVFADLVIATYKYNPAAKPADVYPVTGAIRMLQRVPQPYRIAAAGWSFLPDTPGYYGIEDVKTTDPIQNAKYMRLLKDHLRIPSDSYDLLIRDYSQAFFDSLNVRFIYVPPDQSVSDPRFITRYSGPDGTVLENPRALPRYFLAHGPGDVLLRSYGPNATELDVHNPSWALLVTSDVNWPGWRVYVNDRRLPAVTVNGAFVGCFIPPGGGRVVLRYRPKEFDAGLRLAGAGLVILIVAALALVNRPHPRQVIGERQYEENAQP